MGAMQMGGKEDNGLTAMENSNVRANELKVKGNDGNGEDKDGGGDVEEGMRGFGREVHTKTPGL